MDFTKLHGTGNDFVLVDARNLDRNWASLAVNMCRRHYGIGADGLLLVLPSQVASLRLRMFNPDGSEAEACGNGFRCFARYVTDAGLVDKAEFSVETMAGTRTVQIQPERVVRVSMGNPVFDPSAIPVKAQQPDKCSTPPLMSYSITAGGNIFTVSCVSMGNPHAVCFLDQPVSGFPLTEIGPIVEHLPIFPNRTNFEVANIISRNKINARTWERGAGETLCCGSGACATGVAAIIKGYCDNSVDIAVPGGTVNVAWDTKEEVFLSGPAEPVFTGIWKD